MKHSFSRRLLAHRGLWKPGSGSNSLEALISAAQEGFGIETDLRDLGGRLVISHDPAPLGALNAEMVLKAVSDAARDPIVLALNVKSDGLAPLMQPILDGIGAHSAYFFDMSIPQLVTYARENLPIAIRVSEFKPFRPELFEQLGGLPRRLWLDSFNSDWWLRDPVLNDLVMEASVTIVSPEIHGRDPRLVWDWFIGATRKGADVFLCTDEPQRVLEFAP